MVQTVISSEVLRTKDLAEWRAAVDATNAERVEDASRDRFGGGGGLDREVRRACDGLIG
jgi:hypothetical protein